MSRWPRPDAAGRDAPAPAAPRTPARRALRRRVRVRRLLASVAVGLATWLVVGAALPAAPAGVPVLVAARDLAAGATLEAADVRLRPVDPGLAAAGGLADPAQVAGQRLASPLVTGEAVTATRLVSAGMIGRLAADHRAVHVPLADAGLASLVRAGDRVDVIRAADGARVAADLVVLSVDAADAGTIGGGRWDLGAAANGSGVVLAVPERAVGALVQAAVGAGRAGGVHLAVRPRNRD